MQAPWPLVQDVVLVGGGHAHALVLQKWAMAPLPGVRLTLVDPAPVVPYTGMLPGLIAGHYAREEMLIDLVRLARRAGARLIQDRVTGIDREARLLRLAGRAPLAYDLASLDIGITSDLPELGAHAFSAKPLGAYAAAWEDFVARVGQGARVAIIGAGLGGVELALASAHRLRALAPRVTLIDRGGPLAALPTRARAALLQALTAAGVELLTASPVETLPGAVRLQDGRLLASDFTLTVAGARPQAWLAETGLALHEGFVAVDRHLQSSDPAIFAAGDCVHLPHAPRPKAGVFAVRAAPVLWHNLRAALTGSAPRAFAPQRDYLKLVSLGRKSALAEKWGGVLQGRRCWASPRRWGRGRFAAAAAARSARGRCGRWTCPRRAGPRF